MKRLFTILCAVLTVVTTAEILPAWEFTMKGEFEYRLRYWSRIGVLDLFGNQDTQETVGRRIGLAGPSLWEVGPYAPTTPPLYRRADGNANGVPVTIVRAGFASWDSDARVTDMRFTLYPSFRVNSAISVYATLTFGGFRHKYIQFPYDISRQSVTLFGSTYSWLFLDDLMPGTPPFERYYMSQTSDAAFNTAAIPSLEQMKVVIRLPFGYVSVGTKDFPIGTGATYARNTREEAIYLVLPCGPLAFHTYCFPFQQTSQRTGLGQLRSWYMSPDPSRQASYYLGEVVTYHAGAMELGIGAFTEATHWPPGYAGYTLDSVWLQRLSWLKVNNGRFFINAELAYENGEERNNRRDYPTNPRAYPRLKYFERYHSFVEVGLFTGPTKLSLVWAQSSGPDEASRIANPTKVYEILPINYQAMEPYNYLMFQTYSGGNPNVIRSSTSYSHLVMHADGTGQMGDCRALGVRLDYALAANLNVWGSYLWAHRLERNGYFAGTFGTTITVQAALDGGTAGTTGVTSAQLWKQQNMGFANLNPYVDDGSIGWEAGVGADWKLLEGLTTRLRYAYWQPGHWFDQAYKAFTRMTQGRMGNGMMIGRSPIHAIETSFMIVF